MGWLGSICSSIGSAISSAVSFVGSCIGSIGSVLGDFATKFLSVVGPAIPYLNAILTTIQIIAYILDIIGKDDKVEELGFKATQADKKPEDFDSTKEYIDYLRNEVKLDIEKFHNLKPEQKLGSAAIGIAIVTKGISEKMQMEIPPEFLKEIGRQNFKAEEVKSLIENYKENNVKLVDLNKYLEGKLQIDDNKIHSSVIEQTLKQLNPELSDKDIADKIWEMKQKSRE